MTVTFQSTRPMRGATSSPLGQPKGAAVSIHAPHAGRDVSLQRLLFRVLCFNPRAPCGARHTDFSLLRTCFSFNPRAPCGARHALRCPSDSTRGFQSTRPMRGATRTTSVTTVIMPVSIHAPHAGRDNAEMQSAGQDLVFQSTRPMRGATTKQRARYDSRHVSIHAPHAGRD